MSAKIKRLNKYKENGFMSNLIEQVYAAFKEHFETPDPLLVRSPGRVNLIGEHTDYNEGYVLPAAIDKVVIFALAPNNTNTVRAWSADFDQSFEFDLSKRPFEKSDKGWPNYLMGAVDQLIKNGYELQGFDVAFGGNIPIGAGLSSSAAVEGGVIYGCSELFNLDVPRLDMVKLGQKTEHEFVGVNCGIMDQFINIFGEERRVLRLDCRSLEYELEPFERDDLSIVLCDTQVRRELAGSEYNKRRQQCEEGVEILQKNEPDLDINSLRDASLELVNKHKDKMDPVVYRRCKYVVEENARVLSASDDLEKDDFAAFGKRMYASHAGLRDEYEVSCKELDVLVEEAEKLDGVFGARMMGAGFGGCTINLVREDAVEAFGEAISKQYEKRTGNTIRVYKTQIGPGTKTVKAPEQSATNNRI